MNTAARRRLRALGIASLALAILLLALEFTLLIEVRRFLPGGIAPAEQYSVAPEFLRENEGRRWVEFDQGALAEVRRATENDLGGIETQSRMDIARILRDWTRKQAGEISRVEITSRDPREILRKLEGGASGHCEPLAILYSAALSSYGIDCRRVAFYAIPDDSFSAHSAVEVWDGEKWVLEDPTFNCIALGPYGNPLSAAEMQASYASGIDVEWVQDASQVEPGIEDYRFPPRELSNVLIYQLHGYPPGDSRWEGVLARFRERIAGEPQSVIVSRVAFPIPKIILNGTADRIILPCAAALFLIAIVLLVMERRK